MVDIFIFFKDFKVVKRLFKVLGRLYRGIAKAVVDDLLKYVMEELKNPETMKGLMANLDMHVDRQKQRLFSQVGAIQGRNDLTSQTPDLGFLEDLDFDNLTTKDYVKGIMYFMTQGRNNNGDNRAQIPKTKTGKIDWR